MTTTLQILAIFSAILATSIGFTRVYMAYVAHIRAGTRPPRWLVVAERLREYLASEGPAEDRIARGG